MTGAIQGSSHEKPGIRWVVDGTIVFILQGFPHQSPYTSSLGQPNITSLYCTTRYFQKCKMLNFVRVSENKIHNIHSQVDKKLVTRAKPLA